MTELRFKLSLPESTTQSYSLLNALMYHSNTLVQKDLKLPAELKQNVRIKRRTVLYTWSKSVVSVTHSVMKYVLKAY